jgi:hypothetical protein
MKCSRLLFVTPLLMCGAHATVHASEGTITFHGVVTRSTSRPSPTGTYDPTSLADTTTVLSLNNARTTLSSDVLDFFATYARHDAKFVSVTYK